MGSFLWPWKQHTKMPLDSAIIEDIDLDIDRHRHRRFILRRIHLTYNRSHFTSTNKVY